MNKLQLMEEFKEETRKRKRCTINYDGTVSKCEDLPAEEVQQMTGALIDPPVKSEVQTPEVIEVAPHKRKIDTTKLNEEETAIYNMVREFRKGETASNEEGKEDIKAMLNLK